MSLPHTCIAIMATAITARLALPWVTGAATVSDVASLVAVCLMAGGLRLAWLLSEYLARRATYRDMWATYYKSIGDKTDGNKGR